MAGAGVIVRRLAAIENFGSMDVLCTDKTGTLTEGVVRLDGALDAAGQPSDRVLRLAYLNAHFQTGLTNPLDDAIQAAAPPDIAGVAKVDEIPYDFVRKRLSVVVDEGDGAAPLMITKGALEGVLAACTAVEEGETVAPLDDARQAGLRRVTPNGADRGTACWESRRSTARLRTIRAPTRETTSRRWSLPVSCFSLIRPKPASGRPWWIWPVSACSSRSSPETITWSRFTRPRPSACR